MEFICVKFFNNVTCSKGEILMKNRTSINPDLNWLFGFHILFIQKFLDSVNSVAANQLPGNTS